MTNSQFTVEQFRKASLEKLSFLERKGFHRVPGAEQTSPTGGTVVYLGKHVGFIFSLDVRDQCVDGQVVKVQDGQMKRNLEGGYSSDIFNHLVKYAGYRGKSAGSSRAAKNETNEGALERMMTGWVELLQGAGQLLLTDKSESLPK
jgi:hypothetical protein